MKKYPRASFLGDSQSIADVRRRAAQLADFPFPVLISGETGCGKFELALLMHEKSSRVVEPFVDVHCANLTDTLIESELFGHEKGAFTDARERRLGRITMAAHGTILLDEIDCLTPQAQAKLLRFLDRRTYERVGGSETLQSDASIICATNRDLRALAEDGEFRRDLYERITWAVMTIPPLREHPQDITFLAGMFLEEARERFGVRRLHWDNEALELLEGYSWPGNVRELKAVTYTVAYLHRESSIIQASSVAEVLRDRHKEEPEGDEAGLSGAREHWEREQIADALRRTDGNRSRAAELLNIGRRTLQGKISKYGL